MHLVLTSQCPGTAHPPQQPFDLLHSSVLTNPSQQPLRTSAQSSHLSHSQHCRKEHRKNRNGLQEQFQKGSEEGVPGGGKGRREDVEETGECECEEMAGILQWYFRTGVSFFLLTGVTCSVSGPSEQTGFLDRSLSVNCTYDRSYRNSVKYWCRGAKWSSCRTVVKTRGTEAEVKAQRTSIKDDHTHFQFTVRMENLTEQDADGYWCIIERSGVDLGTPVTITVLPAGEAVDVLNWCLPATMDWVRANKLKFNPDKTEMRSVGGSPARMEEPTTTAASTTDHLSTTSVISTESPNPDNIHILVLPAAFLVLTVILVTALLIMCKIKRQKAAKARADIMLSTAPRQTDGNTSSGTELQNHNETTSPSSDEDTKCAEDVEYASVIARSYASPPQLPEYTEDVAYSTLRFPDLNEDATYANTR
ncbi:CMRF35-like molecule 1 [Varanus komodoensis]|nr:CMRF35-like molecule 1 [Varanus komodoensis]